jgi:hypothetical protein
MSRRPPAPTASTSTTRRSSAIQLAEAAGPARPRTGGRAWPGRTQAARQRWARLVDAYLDEGEQAVDREPANLAVPWNEVCSPGWSRMRNGCTGTSSSWSGTPSGWCRDAPVHRHGVAQRHAGGEAGRRGAGRLRRRLRGERRPGTRVTVARACGCDRLSGLRFWFSRGLCQCLVVSDYRRSLCCRSFPDED